MWESPTDLAFRLFFWFIFKKKKFLAHKGKLYKKIVPRQYKEFKLEPINYQELRANWKNSQGRKPKRARRSKIQNKFPVLSDGQKAVVEFTKLLKQGHSKEPLAPEKPFYQ